MPPTGAPAARIASLDQFRGYTVAGMLLVNFLGGYHAVPALLQHHNTYCSYADTIMPQFFFAVGFAYRLTFLKRAQREGTGAAVRHTLVRCLGLILLGFVLYHLDVRAAHWAELQALGPGGFAAAAFQRSVFQALVHIALASLWVLPVIAMRPGVRVAYLVASLLLHIAVSHGFYFDWVWRRPGIDGGPLGFLTWSVPLLVGSLAFDLVSERGPARALRPMLATAIALMAAGYGLSCVTGPDATATTAPVGFRLAAPPLVPPPADRPITPWTMSQRTGSASYQVFAAGLALALYAGFVVLTDLRGWQAGLFRTFGQNALAAYVIHDLVLDATKPLVPRDAPLWFVLCGLSAFLAICYVLVRSLEKSGIHIKL